MAYQGVKTVGHFVNWEYGLYLPFQFNPTEITRNKQTNYAIEAIPGLDQQVITWVSGGPFTLDFEISFDGRPAQLATGPHSKRGYLDRLFSAVLPNYFTKESVQNILRFLPQGSTTLELIARARNPLGIPLGNHKDLYENPAQYETLDGTAYDEDLGVLPHIAILETFLRPRNLNLKSQFTQFESLGSMQPRLELAREIHETSAMKRFVSPPYLYFYYGPRVFKCRLASAPIVETIHNTKLVPTRVTTQVSLLVVETGDFFESASNNRTVLAMSFSSKFPRTADGSISTESIDYRT